MDLKQRLEHLMAECGWDRSDLIAASGQSQSVVSQWLGHGSKEIKSISKLEAAFGIAELSGFNPLWIARGIGEPKRTEPARGNWPFSRISPETWASLDQGMRDRIEAMIEGAISCNIGGSSVPSTVPAWRGLALQIAAGVDAVTKDDQFTRFVQAVDAQFGDPGDPKELRPPKQ